MLYNEVEIMIRALFLDFDGTLFSHRTGKIPDSTVEALRTLKENGVLVFLCTGRSLPELKDFDLKGLTFSGKILLNGQLICDENDRIVCSRPIEGELKEKLVSYFIERKIPLYFFAAENDNYLNFMDEHVILVQSEVSSDPPRLAEYDGKDFYMATAFVETPEQLEWIASLRDIAEVTYWHEGACDIVPKGITKSFGIELASKIWNIGPDETMAFGDGENDLEMLRDCAIGVAMGNSYDGLRKHADYVTDDIDDDGVYNALKHYGLI